mmetsp:Transcript_38607/g.94737  ORF Transcript_38607/g.94737 Transcript_38607/m.94737 type:complete len:464 (-) Transcript_38607:242-1633(-)
MCTCARLATRWLSPLLATDAAQRRGVPPSTSQRLPARALVSDALKLSHQSSLLYRLDILLQQIPSSAPARDTSVHHAVQQRAATQAVLPVDTAGDLASRIQAGNNPVALLHCCIISDGYSSHGVVDHGGDNSHMEAVVDVKRQVVEKLLPPLVVALARRVGIVFASTLRRCPLHLLRNFVVLLKSLLHHGRIHAHLLRQVSPSLVKLHETTSHVVLAVPGNFVGRLAVQDEAEWPLTLPHPAGHVITPAQFVGKTLAVLVQQHTPDTTESLSSQKLDLRIRLIRMHQAGRVDLHPLQIHGVAAHPHRHLDPVTSAVLTIGGGQVGQVRSMGLQERVRGEVCTEPARSQNDRPVGLALLAILSLVLHPGHRSVRPRDQLGHRGLLQDLRPVRALLHLLKLLDQSVGDGHSRELLSASVGSRLRVATQSRQKRKIQIKPLQPLDRRPALMGQDLHQIRARRPTPQ